jgi:copper chaperone
MKTLKFKTTIKCGGCIAAVKPHLDALEGVSKWSVDLANPDKILTVETENVTVANIQDTLQKIGYQATTI